MRESEFILHGVVADPVRLLPLTNRESRSYVLLRIVIASDAVLPLNVLDDIFRVICDEPDRGVPEYLIG